MHSHDKVNILLVDDQAARLMSYQVVLHELDENLVLAHSGDEALRLLMQMQTDFAVIVLDVNMPGMDGFETAELIHQHPRFEKTPIIFVSGVNVSEFDRLKGYKLGAVDYVLVPVVPEILRSKVMVLVELFRQRAELQRLNLSLAHTNSELAHANELLKAEKAKELQELNGILEDANQQLLLAARRKDEFLAMLGHELRNPLASICNALQIMRVKQEARPDPELVWPRAVLDRQVGKLTRLVDDLLDISRITRDQIELRCSEMDLNQAVANAIEGCAPLLDGRRQTLQVDLPQPPLLAEGDHIRISQVIGNLISNAAKYSAEGSQIRITLRRDGATAVLQVIDSGYGIPAHMLSSIFEPFIQVGETRDRSTGGLGMGLAIVRKLVLLHGGSIEARSPGLDHGSTFEVRLPLAVAPDDCAPDAAPVESAAEPVIAQPEPAPLDADRVDGGPCSVLIADDDLDSANSMALMLRLGGHQVWVARNGAEAVDMAGTHRPQVILLDIGMPVMDGFDAARSIRSQDWGQAMLLVALTGWGQQEDRQRTAEAGFDLHRVKPISPADVLAILAGSRRSAQA